jgi:signal peptidase I
MLTVSGQFLTIDSLINPKVALAPTTGSMRPTFDTGDTLIVDDPVNLKVGNIACYIRKDGTGATHRIIQIQGEYYRFKGDHNLFCDRWVHVSEIIYKVIIIILK